MTRSLTLALVLSLCVLLATQTHGKSEAESGTSKKPGAPTITITELNVTDTTLELYYEIRNDSADDIWICENISIPPSFEVAMDQDGQTLLLRRRLDVPMERSVEQPFGRYVRMRKGESRTESLLLPLPVHPWRILLGMRGLPAKTAKPAKRLAIEIGSYSGDLPGMIYGMLDEAEKDPKRKHIDDRGVPTDAVGWFTGPVWFNRMNEGQQDRDEQVVIPWANQDLKGEQLLRTTADDVLIPYSDDIVSFRSLEIHRLPKFLAQDLSRCTRIDIRYQPSMLEYFFPYTSHRRLLSAAETKYLQSHKPIVVHDQKLLKVLAHEIGEGLDVGGIVTEGSTIHVVCYRDEERLTSFTVYDDTSIETEDKHRFRYRGGLQSLKVLVPQIQPYELRVQCSANLVNLWHRLRLYYKTEKMQQEGLPNRNEIVYPVPAEWCDRMVQAYEMVGPRASIMEEHKCPSAGEGKSHYAMNPNCKPNSPPDTVLLFGTRAGWNQHGGTELFTFDNHDPRGGCVLLNDGTVKFIRTKDELAQLRWR